jgi:hypothetical protein
MLDDNLLHADPALEDIPYGLDALFGALYNGHARELEDVVMVRPKPISHGHHAPMILVEFGCIPRTSDGHGEYPVGVKGDSQRSDETDVVGVGTERLPCEVGRRLGDVWFLIGRRLAEARAGGDCVGDEGELLAACEHCGFDVGDDGRRAVVEDMGGAQGEQGGVVAGRGGGVDV